MAVQSVVSTTPLSFMSTAPTVQNLSQWADSISHHLASQECKKFLAVTVIIQRDITPIIRGSVPDVVQAGDRLTSQALESKGFKDLVTSLSSQDLDPLVLSLLETNRVNQSNKVTSTETVVRKVNQTVVLFFNINRDSTLLEPLCKLVKKELIALGAGEGDYFAQASYVDSPSNSRVPADLDKQLSMLKLEQENDPQYDSLIDLLTLAHDTSSTQLTSKSDLSKRELKKILSEVGPQLNWKEDPLKDPQQSYFLQPSLTSDASLFVPLRPLNSSGALPLQPLMSYFVQREFDGLASKFEKELMPYSAMRLEQHLNFVESSERSTEIEITFDGPHMDTKISREDKTTLFTQLNKRRMQEMDLSSVKRIEPSWH